MTARTVASLALLVVLCSCGQVGPLYLPEDQAATTTVVPAAPVPANGDTAAAAPDTNAAPAADASTAGAASADGTVPDRTNEPRRRAH